MVSQITESLNRMIHDGSPYHGFDADAYACNIKGWAYDNPVFERLVTDLRPRLIIEVGTWLGASAIHMANIAGRHGIDTTILCVDTWLGSAVHRVHPKFKADLGLRHGYPTMYFQFLANVVHTGHQGTIVPFPLSSSAAFDWLHQFGVVADLIYIDGDHEFQTVNTDMKNYWRLLGPKGVMFGDDYLQEWPGVVDAVNRFAESNGIRPQIFDEKWIFGYWKEFERPDLARQ